MKQKKVLIVSFSNHNKDPRIIRQIQALENEYKIETIGLAPYNSKINHYSIPRDIQNFTLRQVQRILHYTHAHSALKKLLVDYRMGFLKNLPTDYDLIICNDLQPLPLAKRLADICGAKLWSDLHEYYPSQILKTRVSQWKNRSFINWLCRNEIPKADYKTIVCQCVADKYQEVFGIQMNAVITNATAYNAENKPQENTGNIKIIHHGVASPLRELHVMVDMMRFLSSNFELHFYLLAGDDSQKEYLADLKNTAVENKLTVIFHKPVPTQQLSDELNQYDIGLFILPPVTHNYYCALPNKLFEFIQARLAIAVSPNPEMKNLVEKNNVGVVAQDYTAKSMAAKINNLDGEKIRLFKQNAHNAAENLSFNANAKQMLQIAKDILK